MSLCFIFSGTSEGRELSETLAKDGVKCLVFVATNYGKEVMPFHENIEVRIGRLEKDDIKELILSLNPDVIYDATHPHATIISSNIISACKEASANEKYIRIERSIRGLESEEYKEYKDTIIAVKSCDEAVKLLEKEYLTNSDGKIGKGNILLTTGVKELHKFCVDSIKDKIVVRVLPGIESIEETKRCGISSKMIIAMEGPFSEDMNSAFIKQYNISVLVTKNSGRRGGFLEKLNACKANGIKAIVIDSVEKPENSGANTKSKKVSIVGTGVCKEEYLTIKAMHIIKSAKLIIGAKRMVEFGKQINPYAETICEYRADEIVNIIKNSTVNEIVVLYSGDTGLCSGTKSLYSKLLAKTADTDLEIISEIIPGISSVSYFASKAQFQYSDYPFISLHGIEKSKLPEAKEKMRKAVLEMGGFVSICSGLNDVKEIIQEQYVGLLIGYNLGLEDEAIFEVDDSFDEKELKEGLYVVAVIQ